MRKLFLCILILIFCANMTGIHAAMIPNDVLETEFEKDVTLLAELGVIEAGEEGLFMPYSRISRAEFAIILQRLIRPDWVDGSTRFEDVIEGHYAREAVKYLAEQGYMNGYDDGLFRPDDEIRYLEAVRVVVAILGCAPMAEYYGGYPSGYVKTAGDLGILNGVFADGEYINKGNVVKLLVNSFDKHPAQVEFVNGQPAYVFDQNYTMLGSICGIYTESGIVEANEDYSISGIVPASKGTLRINTAEFLYEKETDFVGYAVDCYYRVNDDDDKVAVAVIPKKNRNQSYRIEAQEIDTVDASVLYYTGDTDKTKKIKYNTDTVFIYNNKNKFDFVPDDLYITDGFIEGIDNDGDGTVECIKIFEYYNLVVDFVNQDKIIGKYDVDQDIMFEDYNKITVTNNEGEQLSVSDIKRGMAASVFRSAVQENNVLKIVLSDKTVSGRVESVENDERIKYAHIGEAVYVIYQGYRTYSKDYLEYGEKGTYLLDAYNKIVTTITSSFDDFEIGIVVNSKSYYDDKLGDDILDLKVYTQSGRLTNLKAIKKITLDGLKYETKGFQEACDMLNLVSAKPILYKSDSDGMLKIVDTIRSGSASTGKNDVLTEGTPVTTPVRYKSNTKIFEGKLVIDNDTIIFLIPSSFNDVSEQDFKCTDANYFIGNQSYTGLTPYNIEDKIPADIVVMQAETSIINNKSNIALIKAINWATNEDDEAVLNLNVYVDGKEEVWQTVNEKTTDTIYKIDKHSKSGDTLTAVNGQKIQVGDLIKCSFDPKGKISKIAIIYDESERKIVSVNPYHGDFHESGERYVLGKVENKYEGYVFLTYIDSTGAEKQEFHNIGTGLVYLINVRNNRIMEESTTAVIQDEKHNKNGTEIVIIADAGTPKTTFIYQ